MGNNKTLPALVTHLDILKTIAVIFMVIDHIGFYFFPDISWFRALGRFGVPVWFFMAGYANTRELPNRLLVGALILIAADFILFKNVFSMNALVTIILLRLFIDYCINFILRGRYILFIASVLMSLFYFATSMVVEYGTMALMMACLGYMTRHKDKVFEFSFMTNKDYIAFAIFTGVMFCLLQNAQFGFGDFQFLFLCVGTAVGLIALVTMKPTIFPQIQNKMTVKILQFCGRRTLDIYVAHLLLFKVILFVSLALK